MKRKKIMPEQVLTVGELKRELLKWSDDTEIDFGATEAGTALIFYRFKKRGDRLLQIELNEDH
ncbi:hypothetical protein AB7M70_000982 [Bradyrhizobium japonicum]|nr:hypothetical protein [Bradyrhizobium japonicum]